MKTNGPFSDATCLNTALYDRFIDISFSICSREASSYGTWLHLGLKILGKLKRKDDFKIFRHCHKAQV